MGKLLDNVSIKTKIVALVLILSAIIAVQGSLGLIAVKQYFGLLEASYSSGTVATDLVGKILERMSDSRSQVVSAIMHNPATEASKFHDHPIENHFEAISSNTKLITGWIEEYGKRNLDAEEKGLFEKFISKRLALRDDVMKAKAALEKKDFLAAAEVTVSLNATYVEAQKAASELSLYIAKRSVSANERAKADYEWRTMATVSGVAISIFMALTLGWIISSSVKKRISTLSEIIRKTGNEKDLTIDSQIGGKDEITAIAGSFSSLTHSFRSALGEIQKESSAVESGSSEIRNSSSEIRQSNALLADSVAQIAATAEELSVSISEVGTNAGSVTELVREETRVLIQESAEVVADAVQKMNGTANLIRKADIEIEELAKASAHIASIAQTIGEIASQTNLLALNAAIEAARAGDAGRGFSVVADEVRKLSEHTSTATKEASSHIADICSRIITIRDSMEKGVESIASGEKTGAEAVQKLSLARASGERASEQVAEISNAVREQARAMESVTGQLERIAQASEEASANADASLESAMEMQRAADSLRGLSARFRT